MTIEEARNELLSNKDEKTGGWGFMCGECPDDCKKCELAEALDIAIAVLTELNKHIEKASEELCDQVEKKMREDLGL